MHWQLLTAVLVVAAPAPAEDKKKDEDKIQGTWAIVSAQSGGEDKPGGTKDVKFVIKGDLITIQEPKREGKEEKAKFKLDATKKPKTIDLIPSDRGGKEELMPGIYELKDDELKLCFVKGTKGERPTEFSSKAGTEQVLIVLKREKKDK